MSVLVVDVGTSSMRSILYSARGRRLGESRAAYAPRYLEGGVVEQDAGDFLAALAQVARGGADAAREAGDAVELVSLTSQRSSICPLDAAGAPLAPFIMWQDTRIRSLVEELAREDGRVFALSGTRVNTVFSGAKMAWVERAEPSLAAGTARYVTIPELLLHEMTGEWAIDRTYASRSNLMNIRSGEWDPELLELFGVPRAKLSGIVEPGRAVGCVREGFSAATGIAAGTPVVSAGGDQQCASAGQGVVEPGRVSVVAGTGAFAQTAVAQVPEDLEPDVICNAACVAGLYTLETSVPACCSAFDWYRRQFMPDADFDEIARILAAEHEKCSPAAVLPHFQGRGTPDWNPLARGVFAGVDLSATRESLLYSLVAGIFIEVAQNLAHMGRYVPLSQASVSGGLTQSAIVNQIQADVYGLPVRRQEDFESTARGALISALAGTGMAAGPREAYAAVSEGIAEQVFLPDENRHELLRRAANEAQSLYARLYN